MARKILKGIPVSPGIAIAPGLVSDTAAIQIPVYRIQPSQVEGELERFHSAIAASRTQVRALRERIEEKLGSQDAMIFLVHLQLLEDSSLLRKVEEKVRSERINIEAAIKEVIAWYTVQIEGLDDTLVIKTQKSIKQFYTIFLVIHKQTKSVKLFKIAQTFPLIIYIPKNLITPNILASNNNNKTKVLSLA